MQKPCGEACCGGSYIWGRSAALAWERAWPPALIIRLNVNKAGLVIQLSSRCTCLFHCQAPGPHGEPPQVFRDSHRSKQPSNIAVTTPSISWDPLARPFLRGCLYHFLWRQCPIPSKVSIANWTNTGYSMTAWLEFRTVSLIPSPLLKWHDSETATTA